VDGTNAYTVSFDRDKLGLTPYINVPWMFDRYQTLLAGEPSKAMAGPFEADGVNLHTCGPGAHVYPLRSGRTPLG
jgi:hypothetical protein